jgi:hypothetical protein
VIFGIARADGRRGRHHRTDWRVTGALFTVSAAASGAAVGAVLGFLGGQLSLGLRAYIGVVIAVIALAVGTLSVAGVRVPVPQWNRQTPQRWLGYGAIRWSVLNGVALGAGFLSRIEFLAWYAVPIASFCFGQTASGIVIFGSYGLARGALVWLLLLTLVVRHTNQTDLSERLFTLNGTAHRVGGYVLLSLAISTIVALR